MVNGTPNMDRVKILIESGQFQYAINNVEYELEYMEDIKRCINVYEQMEKGCSAYIKCPREDLLAYLNEEHRYRSYDGKFTTFDQRSGL